MGLKSFAPSGHLRNIVNYKKKICTQKQQKASHVPKYCKLIYNYLNSYTSPPPAFINHRTEYQRTRKYIRITNSPQPKQFAPVDKSPCQHPYLLLSQDLPRDTL
ncbi:hypothetical protein Barb4_03391 [Bacteroidales bacterium Barb4]|nr:hypothetical protein Barb4_03391 [Bacteroidales bacterium Barb4]